MKKGIILLGIAASLLALSCSKISPAGENESMTKVTLGAALEQQTSGTKTALVTGNVVWSLNDKLSVLSSENATGGDLFTLQAASAGQASGKFDGELSTADEYFALYPYAATAALADNAITFPVAATQEYVANGFANGANASVAPFTYATKNSLNFKNIFGVLKLSLKAASADIAVNSIVVSDNANAMLNGSASVTTASITSGEPSATISGGNSTITLTFSTAKIITSSAAVDFYIVVPAGAFANGFTAQVNCADGYRKVSTTKDNTIKRSIIRAMPEVTLPAAGETAIDLSELGNANCYVVPTTTTTDYRFIATKKGNASASTLVPTAAVLVWETDNTANTLAANSIVKDITYSGGYVYFTATGTPGNALIAVTDGTDILWSWHIWCVSDLENKGPFPNGKYCIDRELGALSSAKDNTLAAGLRYQWGRKDPFMGPANYKSSTSAEFNAKYSNGYSFQNPNTKCDSVAVSIKNPTTIYATSTGWLSTNNDSLWGDTKTIYDPCPVGYKVAPKGTWTNTEKDSWSCGYTLSTKTTPAVDLGFFPAAGFRSNTSGLLSDVSSGIYCWSSYSSGGAASFLRANSSSFRPENSASNNHGFACPVRCCKE